MVSSFCGELGHLTQSLPAPAKCRRVRLSAGLYGFKFLECLAIFVFPSGEPVCMATVNHGRRCARTGELRVFGKKKMVALNCEDTLVFQSLPHIYGPGIFLGGRSYIQNGL